MISGGVSCILTDNSALSKLVVQAKFTIFSDCILKFDNKRCKFYWLLTSYDREKLCVSLKGVTPLNIRSNVSQTLRWQHIFTQNEGFLDFFDSIHFYSRYYGVLEGCSCETPSGLCLATQFAVRPITSSVPVEFQRYLHEPFERSEGVSL